MKISEIYKFLYETGEAVSGLPDVPDREISGLSCDDRRCRAGDLFFCKGRAFVKDHARNAFSSGAQIAVCDSGTLDETSLAGVPFFTVRDVKRAMAMVADTFYGHPFGKLTSIAVTGTKGKSSTVNIIRDAFSASPEINCALLTDFLPPDAPHLTTPESLDLFFSASEAVKHGITHLICEVSSQAVKEKRVHGVVFDCVCFLNFGEDHISPTEHESVREYFECKAELMLRCRRAVIDRDSPVFPELMRRLAGSTVLQNDPKTGKRAIYTFSASGKDADVKITEKVSTPEGARFTVKTRAGTSCRFCVAAPGEHDVLNALAAISVAFSGGVGYKAIFPAVLAPFCEGRGEYLTTKDGRITVLVDYAHNKMSFEATFGTVAKRFPGIPVTAVFGCPGGKAYGRRRDLPEVALRYADRVILCEEDSGKEGFESIKNDLLASISTIRGNVGEARPYPSSQRNEAPIHTLPGNGDTTVAIPTTAGATPITAAATPITAATVTVIEDRGTAIKSAVLNAFENGEKRVIVVTGKGRERFMMTATGSVPCEDDLTLAKEAVAACDARISASALLPELKKHSGETVLIAVRDAFSAYGVLPDVPLLLFAGVRVVFLCGVDTGRKIRDLCFATGVIASETVFSGVRSVKIIPVERSGEKAFRGAIDEAISAERPEHFVYFARKAEIIINGRPLVGMISPESLDLILSLIDLPLLRTLRAACTNGAARAAVIKGGTPGAAPRFICGSPSGGTETERKPETKTKANTKAKTKVKTNAFDRTPKCK